MRRSTRTTNTNKKIIEEGFYMGTKRIELIDFVLNTITPEEADKLLDHLKHDSRFSDCFPIKPRTQAQKNALGKDCCDGLMETALQLKNLYPEGDRKMTTENNKTFLERSRAIRRFLCLMEEEI